MLGDREIYNIAFETHYEFSVDYLIECKFEVIIINKFIKMLEKSGIIAKLLENKSNSPSKNNNK